LTAFVDGEVSARQRKAVQRLLHESADARALLQQFQENAKRLRDLPRRQLEPAFASRVLQSIAQRRVPHGRHRPMEPARPAVPAWVGLGVAASILFLIGVGSYLYFEAAQEWHNFQAAANRDAVTKSAQENALPEESPVSIAQQPDEPPSPLSETSQKPESAPKVANSGSQSPSAPEGHEAPEAKQPGGASKLAVPTPKRKDLEEVSLPTVAMNLPVRELDRANHQQRLHKELQPDQCYRLELTCLDKSKAVERLQTALRSRGIRLLIDQDASVRLKNRRLKTDYALYTEGITVAELAKILEQLGRSDKQAESKKRGDGQFDQLLILSLTADDRKELSTLLGVDPLQAQPAKHKAPLGVDIRQPISSGTVAQVSQSLAGQGTPRPEPGKPINAKPAEKLAVLLAYSPVRTKPASSKEIRQFLDSRPQRQAGTVQVFLVLRNVAGL
jgi:hypothetical protein